MLEALGGKWSRSAQAHVFEGDPNDAIAAAIASGEVVDWKKEFQFFETPAELADRMVAEGLRGQTILEPSAGHGALLDAVRRQSPKEYESRLVVHAFEINPRCQTTLLAKHPGIELLGADFLQYDTRNSYDSIIMNPPFNHGQDVRHVRHAYDMLRPGGCLTAITSPGWSFRQDRAHREFREWIESSPARVEELPHGTFKASGTNVRATLLVIDKSPNHGNDTD